MSDHIDKSDKELVELARGGDENAFCTLVTRHSRRAYQIAWALLQNKEDAEEVAQDAFLKIHNALPKFRGDSEFTTWLHTIVSNLAKNKYRWNKSRNQMSNVSIESPSDDSTDNKRLDFPDANPSPLQKTLWNELSSQLAEALAKMPEIFRIPLLLHNVDGLPYDEIARILECEMGTVKSRIARAREFLKQNLQ